MACSAVKRIFAHLPADKPKVGCVACAIGFYSDTDNPDTNRRHPSLSAAALIWILPDGWAFTQRKCCLNGQNFSPDTIGEMLTICVLSYASLRIDSKKKDIPQGVSGEWQPVSLCGFF